MILYAYVLHMQHIKNYSIYDLSIKTYIAFNARQDTDTGYWSLGPLLLYSSRQEHY